MASHNYETYKYYKTKAKVKADAHKGWATIALLPSGGFDCGSVFIRVVQFVVAKVIAVDVVEHCSVADWLYWPEVVSYLAMCGFQLSEYFNL